MEDMRDLKSLEEIREGSNPSPATKGEIWENMHSI